MITKRPGEQKVITRISRSGTYADGRGGREWAHYDLVTGTPPFAITTLTTPGNDYQRRDPTGIITPYKTTSLPPSHNRFVVTGATSPPSNVSLRTNTTMMFYGPPPPKLNVVNTNSTTVPFSPAQNAPARGGKAP